MANLYIQKPACLIFNLVKKRIWKLLNKVWKQEILQRLFKGQNHQIIQLIQKIKNVVRIKLIIFEWKMRKKYRWFLVEGQKVRNILKPAKILNAKKSKVLPKITLHKLLTLPSLTHLIGVALKALSDETIFVKSSKKLFKHIMQRIVLTFKI